MIDVRAAAVDSPDILVVASAYRVLEPLPFVPGSELSGEVLAVGTDVRGIQKGDRIFGTVMTGAFAERAVLAAGLVNKMPGGCGFPKRPRSV